MMEGAYFVGRVELLNWLNDFLQLDYKKVEQVCSGSAYCQLMDALYPGKVPLSKVNFNAKFEYEYLKNFAVLQGIFEKVGIDKRIDVNTLIKGKFQDNLEFLQWMKKYFDMHYGGDPYDAVGRRQGKGGAPPKTSPGSKKVSGNIKTASSSMKSPTQPKVPTGTSNVKVSSGTTPAKATKATQPASKTTPPSSGGGGSERVQQLEQQVEELQAIAADLEKERDFYFNKLREVEVLCQSVDQNELTADIFRILSSSDETEGNGEEAPQEEAPPKEEEEEETY